MLRTNRQTDGLENPTHADRHIIIIIIIIIIISRRG